MKKFQLTKLAMALVVVMFGFQAMAQGRIDLNGAKSAQQCTIASQDGLSATFSFGSIEATEVSNERGVFSFLEMDGAYSAGNIGEPNLPAANKLIAVPVGAKDVTVNVKNYTTEVYNLADYGINRIYPMQPKLRKDQKPEDIPFEGTYSPPLSLESRVETQEVRSWWGFWPLSWGTGSSSGPAARGSPIHPGVC